jgi:segregation and condensation protein B
MRFDLQSILKALLMSTSEPLSIRDVQGVIKAHHQQPRTPARAETPELPPESRHDEAQSEMEDLLDQVPSMLTATQIRDAMDALAAQLETSEEVVRLVQGPTGYRITVAPKFAYWVRLLRGEGRPLKLSSAALETLAIVAYRQPVTRAEMEALRGVSVDGPLTKLQELQLVEATGRADLPGRPTLFSTTDAFLEYAGLTSLEQLPASDILSPEEMRTLIREHNQQQTMPLGDREMGLAGTDDL